MSKVVERFLKYVTYDTQSSDEAEGKSPSTQGQKEFARILLEELKEIGVEDIEFDEEHGYIYATIEGTVEGAPTLGFIAHMDTSPAMSGKDVKPRIINDYSGANIVLHKEKQIIMEVADFPELLNYKGKRLIVTDGTTLLGADDKAGIAEIITVAEILLQRVNEIPHGKIRIAFTPDEEIGQGADYFDVKKFAADYAYTIDGGEIGELEYENFNAAGAKLTVHGRSVHPGSAKNKMLNAILLAMEFQGMLPVHENPMYTENYEGFFHADSINGGVEEVVVDYIIRDHDKNKFELKKELFLSTADYLNKKYGEKTFEIDLKDSYYNMKEAIQPHMHLIENAKEAMKEEGIEAKIQPIRGGTDGARLSFMGLPCPNLFTGGHNFHGKYEYICIESMESVINVLLRIIQKYSK